MQRLLRRGTQDAPGSDLFPLRRVVPAAREIPPGDDSIWRSLRLPREKTPGQRGVRRVAVSSLASRLIQRERAKVTGRTPADLGAYALEEAGRRWEEQRRAGGPRR